MNLPTTINNNLDNFSKVVNDGNVTNITNVGIKIRDNIQSIIKQMIDNRLYTKPTAGGSSSDAVKRDIKFLNKLENDLIDQITKYTKETDKLIDLDAILIDISKQLTIGKTTDNTPDGNELHENIISDIANIIINDLNNIIRDKIQAKIVDSIKIKDIKTLIDHLKTFLTKTYSSSVLNAAITSFNTNIRSKSIDTARKKYRDTITNLYKKEVFDKIDQRRHVNERLEKQKIPKSFNIFKNLNDTISERRASLLVDNIIFQINLGITQKLRTIIVNSLKFMVHIPNLILKYSLRALKLVMTLTLIPLLFKGIGNFVIKPFMKVFIDSLSLMGGFIKKIFKNLMKVVKRVTLSKFLLTPIGIYSVGFIIGFIWEKLKKILPFYNEDISLLENIKIIWSDILNIYNIVNNSIKEWIDNHPKISSAITKAGEDFTTVIEAFKTGNYKLLEDTNTVNYIETTIDKIENSLWFRPIKIAYMAMSGIITSISEFIINHPTLSLTLFGIAETFLNLSPFFRVISPIKGHLGRSIAGAFAAGILEHSIDSIFGAFDSRGDEGIYFLEKNVKELFDSKGIFFDADIQNRLKNGLSSLDENVKKKYNYLVGYLSDEQNIIIRSKRVIDLLNNYHGVAKTKLNEKASKSLNNILLYIIGSDKSMTVEQRMQKIRDIKKNGLNNFNYIKTELTNNLNNRTIFASNVYHYLSHLHIDSIKTGLDNIIDDNFELVKRNIPFFTNPYGITESQIRSNMLIKRSYDDDPDLNPISPLLRSKEKQKEIQEELNKHKDIRSEVLAPTDLVSDTNVSYYDVKKRISQLDITNYNKEILYKRITELNAKELSHLYNKVLTGDDKHQLELAIDLYLNNMIGRQDENKKSNDAMIDEFSEIIKKIKENTSIINDKNISAINDYIVKYDKMLNYTHNIFKLIRIKENISNGTIQQDLIK